MDRTLLIALAVLLIPQPSRAQVSSKPDAGQAEREAREASTELTITRVYGQLQLSPAQAGRLLPVLEQVQARLKEADRSDAATLARLGPSLDESRRQALAGRAPSPTAEQRYESAMRDADSRRRRLRDELVVYIRGNLARILTPQQAEAIQEIAQAVAAQEMRDRARAEFASGARGGGPLNNAGQTLDRFRSMPQEQFDRMQQGARGGGPPLPQDVEQRRAAMAAMAAQVRQMSPEEFLASKGDLALRYWEQSGGQQGRRRDPDTELDQFIERYLLQPAAVTATRRRAGRS